MKISLPKRKDWLWIIILTIIGLLPNIFLAIYGSDLNGFFLKTITFLAISAILYFTPSLFLKARTFFLVQSVFILVAPIEIAHIFMSRVPTTKAFMIAVFSSNFGETIELLSSMPLYIIACMAVWVFYFYIAIKKIDNTYIMPPLKLRLPALAAVVGVLFIGYGYYYFFHTSNLSVKNSIYEANRIMAWKFNKIYPYSFIFNTEYALKEKNKVKKSRELLKDVHFDAIKRKEIAEREIYIIVIGETARYDNFSINGYKRPTSPLLEKQDNLITYSDFLSEASLTLLSLPNLLTNTTPHDFEEYHTRKSLVDAYKEAGFNTYWIANQSVENGFVKRIAQDADDYFFSTVDYDADASYDENLIPHLKDALEKNHQKTLIVLHTLGSHFKYNFRYPPEFNIFRPSIEGNFDTSFQNPKNREVLINTYDNSILYTDFFLSNVIQILDSLDAVSSLIYVSDHGENIYDTEDKIILHGGRITTRYDFHVPMLIWYSDQYKENYPLKIENLESHKDKKLSMSYLFHTIMDIADITYPEENLTKSIASDKLIIDSVRYVLQSDYTVKEVFY